MNLVTVDIIFVDNFFVDVAARKLSTSFYPSTFTRSSGALEITIIIELIIVYRRG